jgi:Protein of unknown function, DUF547
MRKLVMAALVMAAGSACGSTLKPDEAAMKGAAASFPFDEWDALLGKYVDGKGRVDYNRLKGDAADSAKLEHLFASVAAASVDKLPSKAAKEAFYLDAYNVCVWKNVLTRLPKLKNVDSEKASFFYFTKFIVAGKEMNLQDLESKAIRPTFKDGRVHFALNCASGGCPQLPPYAFTPAKLDEQLNQEARKFVAEKRNVDFDPATKKLKLSHIFDWYKDDFGKADDKVIGWINNFRAADAKLPTDAKIDYVDYDWTLNDVNLLKR